MNETRSHMNNLTSTRMTAIPKKVSRRDLLALPERLWNEQSTYDWLYIVPTGRKHDSGYGVQAIVGVNRADGGPVGEIAAQCDDVCWSFPVRHPYDRMEEGKHRMILRTDCEFPSGILRFWASGENYFKGRFHVGTSLSSVDVELVIEPSGDPEKLREHMNSLRSGDRTAVQHDQRNPEP